MSTARFGEGASAVQAAILRFCSGVSPPSDSWGRTLLKSSAKAFDAAVRPRGVLAADLPASVEFVPPRPVGALDASVEFGRSRRQGPEVDDPGFEFGFELASAVDLDRLHLERRVLDDFVQELAAVLFGGAPEGLGASPLRDGIDGGGRAWTERRSANCWTVTSRLLEPYEGYLADRLGDCPYEGCSRRSRSSATKAAMPR